MDTIDINDEETIIFSQLPSVEEYKTNVGYRSGASATTSRPTIKMPLNHLRKQDHPDPDGLFAADVLTLKPSTSIGSSSYDDEFQEDFGWHHSPAFGKSPIFIAATRVVLLIFSLTVVAVVTIVVVGKRNPKTVIDDSSAFSWIRHSERYQSVESFLVENTISKQVDFQNNSSPPFLAAQWLAHEDKMQLSIPDTMSEKHGVTFIERYAMTVVYFGLGGPKWMLQANFLSENHVTTWHEREEPKRKRIMNSDGTDTYIIGVQGCRSDEDDTLYPCSLSLPSNNLVGTVPDEMKFLSRIEILTLPYNPDLTGSLPDGLGRMGQLSHLSLQWCGLQGTFPTWLSDVEKLQYLMLGNNHLTGSIPDEIWRLGNLKVLGLDNNMLSAKLDVFGSLPNLKSLYVEGNLISGSLTSELMAGWDAMEELDLGENFLGGMLPEQFFLQPNDALKILDLHGNQFQGSLPNAIDQDHFQNLEYLALAKNKFTGIVPEHIGRLTGLKHLDLSLNYFTWILPDSLGQLTSLEYLFTGGNQFDNSPIPGFLIYLTNLRDLSMRSNNLTGSIPLILVQLSKLELLDLHDNNLIGSIPSFIGSLSELNVLLFKSNFLDGTLPSEMGQLTNLDILLLEQNSLFGDATVICDNPDMDVETFVSDCKGSDDYFSFQCSCCDECCAKNESPDDCNAWDWDGNWDPAWEHGFRKDSRSPYDNASMGQLHGSKKIVLP